VDASESFPSEEQLEPTRRDLMPELNADLKAELLAIGSVDVESMLAETSTSSAGPGTGLKSLFFTSGGHRVRLEINRNSQLKMIRNLFLERKALPKEIKKNNDLIILKDDKELVRGEIEQILAHCPEQAYITLRGCLNLQG
jgi:hypothetical protein